MLILLSEIALEFQKRRFKSKSTDVTVTCADRNLKNYDYVKCAFCLTLIFLKIRDNTRSEAFL